jgi:hypothetical protein
MEGLTPNELSELGASRWSERLKQYLRGLSSGQKVVLALNSAVVVVGLCFQALFLSTYDWVFLFDMYLLKKQTLIWTSHALYLLLVVCPVAVLLARVKKGKISLEYELSHTAVVGCTIVGDAVVVRYRRVPVNRYCSPSPQAVTSQALLFKQAGDFYQGVGMLGQSVAKTAAACAKVQPRACRFPGSRHRPLRGRAGR